MIGWMNTGYIIKIHVLIFSCKASDLEIIMSPINLVTHPLSHTLTLTNTLTQSLTKSLTKSLTN